MKFERMEPTTGGALSESQREIFKILSLDEGANPDEIVRAFAQMTRIYEDKNSPGYLHIKDAYEKLQQVRENLPPVESIKYEPQETKTIRLETISDPKREALAVLGLPDSATPDDIIDAYTSQYALYRNQIKGDQWPPALIRIKDAYTILKGTFNSSSSSEESKAA